MSTPNPIQFTVNMPLITSTYIHIDEYNRVVKEHKELIENYNKLCNKHNKMKRRLNSISNQLKKLDK